MNRFMLLVILLLGGMMTAAQCGAPPTPQESVGPQIKVVEPWSRPSPMKAGNGAVYMELKNEGGRNDALLSAEADIADVVELHETKMEGDVMKMSPVAKIEVPAGGSASLKPGGLHVMLINLKREMVAGEKVRVTLNFEESGPITVEAEIREMGDMGKMEMEGKEE